MYSRAKQGKAKQKQKAKAEPPAQVLNWRLVSSHLVSWIDRMIECMEMEEKGEKENLRKVQTN